MILFICHGNVARSQYAEALYKKITHQNAVSAGVGIKPAKEGIELINDGETAQKCVKYFQDVTGIDISHKKRNQVTVEMVRSADRVISMVSREALPGFVLENCRDIQYWVIADPHHMDLDGFCKVIKGIETNVRKLS